MTAPAASSPCFAKRSALAGPLYGATAHATRLIRPALSPARHIFSKPPPRPFTLSQVARDRDPLSTDSGSTLLEPSHPPLGLSAFLATPRKERRSCSCFYAWSSRKRWRMLVMSDQRDRLGNTDRDGKFIAPRSCLLEGPGIADPQSGLVPTISQLGLYPADLRRSAARH